MSAGEGIRRRPGQGNSGRRPRRSCVSAVVATILLIAGDATQAGAASPLFEQAERALADRVPAVAIRTLETLLSSKSLSVPDRDAARLKLAEALLAAGRHQDALSAIDAAGLASPEARLLRAHSLAGSGRWAEALPEYQKLASPPEALLPAALGEAESFQALGQLERAIPVLETVVRKHPELTSAQLRLASLFVEVRQLANARALLARINPTTPHDSKWAKYVEGKLLLAEDHPAPALALFQELVNDQIQLSENLLVGATLGITEVLRVTRGSEEADDVVERYIHRHPDSALLEIMFRAIDSLYSTQVGRDEDRLQRWAQREPARRAALALFYVARLQVRDRKYEKAALSLKKFVDTYGTHPLLPHAEIMRANLFSAKRQFTEAVSALEAAARRASSDDLRAEIELRTGLVHAQAGEFLLAGNLFDLAAKRSPKLREIAVYDGALAALNQQNPTRFLELYRELSSAFPESAFRSELVFEEGLLEARHDNPRAATTIARFIEHFPQHPRNAEARLALAELEFQSGNAAAAERLLQVAMQVPAPRELNDQARFLEIVLSDKAAGRDDARTIELARAFLNQRSNSPLVPDVRMKLGEVYFRSSDFPSAETEFTTLVRETPQSVHAEAALFFGGQAAMKTMNTGSAERALQLFDQVVKREGRLKLYARQQQAIVQTAMGKEAEAIKLYDIILAAQPPAVADLRFAALAGKAHNLALLGRKVPAQSEAALAVYDELASAEGVTASWRNQALYKKAKLLEQLGRSSDSIVAYYDVLDRGTDEGREFFWFYKAGADLAGKFEAQDQLKSAIALYEKMASVNGPQATDFKKRAKELRLKHFIWE